MFDTIERACLEAVHLKADPATGLRAIIAIHSTRFGPALGGCRFLPYSSDRDALHDAARLAHGMSYKAALADVPQGGGKAVILAPGGRYNRTALFRAFGRFVESLDGRYITAVDSGSSLSDMDQVETQTRHVSGSHNDGLDPSPETAYGVFCAIQAACQLTDHSNDFHGKTVAIQGLGQVGWALAQLLRAAGADLLVSDLDAKKVQAAMQSFDARAIAPLDIHRQPCDIFAPCALGAVLNHQSVQQLRCRLVVGSANNQLETPSLAQWLDQHDILYIPDYVANAGGLIKVSLGKHGKSLAEIRAHTERIGVTVGDILRRAAQQHLPPADIADRLAQERLDTPNVTDNIKGERYALSR
jgi:leucine dehydrogenase